MGSITRRLRNPDRHGASRLDRSRVGRMTAAVLLVVAAFAVPRLALACAVGITNA
jgi:hypothetical protein